MSRWKCNNKGNTLGVVVVGIALLGILGSLLLNVTMANYQMKISDTQSKKNFYYVEKALDEIYAGIGVEVLDAVRTSYATVLESQIEKGKVTNSDGDEVVVYTPKEDDACTKMFAENFFAKMKSAYFNGEGVAIPVQSVQDKYIKYMQGTRQGTSMVVKVENAEVELLGIQELVLNEDKTDPLKSSIVIKGVTVTSRTMQGYYASVTTDIEIKLPDGISMALKDTTPKNWDEFYKFALIADGYHSYQYYQKNGYKGYPDNTLYKNDTAPTITVNTSSDPNTPDTCILGNVYSGKHTLRRKDGIKVQGGGYLRSASGRWIAEGQLNLENGNAEILGIGTSALDDMMNHSEKEGWIPDNNTLTAYGLIDGNGEKLKLWVNSLVTSPGLSARLKVEGDCYIADDLEVNGDNSTVQIAGNYFGYGAVMVDGDEVGIQYGGQSGLTGATVDDEEKKYDHELRSAIIVNGKRAYIEIRPFDEKDTWFVLGGRAFIDLMDNGRRNPTYMTGESVSLKGNQNVYKAPLASLGTSIPTNPFSLATMKSKNLVDASGNILSALTTSGYDQNAVLMRENNGLVYFYKKDGTPKGLTDFFMNAATVTNTDDIKEQIQKLEVQDVVLNLHDGGYQNKATVGVVTQVDEGALMPYDFSYVVSKNSSMGSFEIGNSTLEMVVKELENRFYYMLTELDTSNDREDVDYGNSSLSGTIVKQENPQSIYSYFVSEPDLKTLVDPTTGVYYNTDALALPDMPQEAKNKILSLGIGSSIRIMMIDNAGKQTYQTGTPNQDVSAGIVIATGNVEVNSDFTGMVIAGGNVTIAPGKKLQACPAIVECLCKYDEKLANLFGNLSGNASDSNKVSMSDLQYQNILTFQNWRKTEQN